jgi:hypothetical protein
MKKSRSVRRSVRRSRSKKPRNTKRRYRASKSSRRRYKRRRTRHNRKSMRRSRKMQKGGSGLGSALYNAAFVGSGPPLGTDPKSKAAQDCAAKKEAGVDLAKSAGLPPAVIRELASAAAKTSNKAAGCDASFFCSMQSGASDSAKGGVDMGALCQNGAALLGQGDPPPGSPFGK